METTTRATNLRELPLSNHYDIFKEAEKNKLNSNIQTYLGDKPGRNKILIVLRS